jgi:hypothetical protein
MDVGIRGIQDAEVVQGVLVGKNPFGKVERYKFCFIRTTYINSN